jgi:hypothetical protein
MVKETSRKKERWPVPLIASLSVVFVLVVGCGALYVIDRSHEHTAPKLDNLPVTELGWREVLQSGVEPTSGVQYIMTPLSDDVAGGLFCFSFVSLTEDMNQLIRLNSKTGKPEAYVCRRPVGPHGEDTYFVMKDAKTKRP